MTEINRILFVPGYRNPDSSVMMERLRKVYDLWWQDTGPVYDWIIVSGGIARPYQSVPEAVSMKNWLVANSAIAPGRIIVEDSSRDSFESVRNIVEGYLTEPMLLSKDTEVTIVSQWEHAIRLRITFSAYGIRTKIVSVPGYSPGRRLLEWGYVLYTLLDPKGESRFSKWKAGRSSKTPQRA